MSAPRAPIAAMKSAGLTIPRRYARSRRATWMPPDSAEPHGSPGEGPAVPAVGSEGRPGRCPRGCGLPRGSPGPRFPQPGHGHRVGPREPFHLRGHRSGVGRGIGRGQGHQAALPGKETGQGQPRRYPGQVRRGVRGGDRGCVTVLSVTAVPSVHGEGHAFERLGSHQPGAFVLFGVRGIQATACTGTARRARTWDSR